MPGQQNAVIWKMCQWLLAVVGRDCSGHHNIQNIGKNEHEMPLISVLYSVSMKICPCKIHHMISDKPEHQTFFITSDRRKAPA